MPSIAGSPAPGRATTRRTHAEELTDFETVVVRFGFAGAGAFLVVAIPQDGERNRCKIYGAKPRKGDPGVAENDRRTHPDKQKNRQNHVAPDAQPHALAGEGRYA